MGSLLSDGKWKQNVCMSQEISPSNLRGWREQQKYESESRKYTENGRKFCKIMLFSKGEQIYIMLHKSTQKLGDALSNGIAFTLKEMCIAITKRFTSPHPRLLKFACHVVLCCIQHVPTESLIMMSLLDICTYFLMCTNNVYFYFFYFDRSSIPSWHEGSLDGKSFSTPET